MKPRRFRLFLLPASTDWTSLAEPCLKPRRGLRVRSKRRGPGTVGVVEEVRAASDRSRSFYNILVRWPNGTKEWCREGELRGLRRWDTYASYKKRGNE